MAKFTDAKTLKYALIPVLVLVFLAFYPQLNLFVSKGSTWQGAYFVSNYDEVAYSAYVNALIEGKPRKYDPYLAAETTYESLYSIQVVPAYSIALPARILGLSASTAFIVLGILSAAFSAFFIFWLLFMITGDELLSAAGVLVICGFGTAAAFQGELRSMIEGRVLVDYLPFLRRYQPGFAFPLFFLFCSSVWLSLVSESRKKTVLLSLASGGIFVLLIFSYFYLWTAAAAWLGYVYVLTLVFNRSYLKNIAINAGVVGIAAIASLIPYFKLLSERSPNVDAVQLLTNTHLPNFASPSLIIGLLVAAGIAVFAWRGDISLASPRTLFALAFALTPVILFNQQIITGRSLQPVHYEIFISNYLVLMAAMLLISLATGTAAKGERGPAVRRGFVYLAIIAALWGVVEAVGSTRRSIKFADLRDLSIPALRLIGEQTKQNSDRPPVVLATNFVTADFVPSVGNFRPLWSSHTTSAGGVSIAENKRLFYCYLYYSGFTDKDLLEALRVNSFEVTAAIFGSERALPALANHAAPITVQEIVADAKLYSDFEKNFDALTASNPVLSYVIVPTEGENNFTNLDRWYERDAGTQAGLFKVFHVKLRQ